MDTLIVILKVLLIGVITPLGAALIIWELAQAILGRPLRRQPAPAPADTQGGEDEE